MARRAGDEKFDYLLKYHGVVDPEPEEEEEKSDEADGELEESERTQTCRFCTGSMHLTGRTLSSEGQRHPGHATHLVPAGSSRSDRYARRQAAADPGRAKWRRVAAADSRKGSGDHEATQRLAHIRLLVT